MTTERDGHGTPRVRVHAPGDDPVNGRSATAPSQPQQGPIKAHLYVEIQHPDRGFDQFQCEFQLPEEEAYDKVNEQLQRLHGGWQAAHCCSYQLWVKDDQPLESQEYICDKQLEEAIEQYREGGCIKIVIRAQFPPREDQKDPRTIREELVKSLQQHTKMSQRSRSHFIPTGALHSILTLAKITKLFEEDEMLRKRLKTQPDLVERVRNEAMKLLALFLIADSYPLGGDFLTYWEKNMRDRYLPFTQSRPLISGNATLFSRLLNMQWQVMAIELKPLDEGTDPKVIQYPQQRVIPSLEEEALGTGASGNVLAVRFEESHQKIYRLEDDPNPRLALKQFKRTQEVAALDFKAEANMLIALHRLNHNYIVRLLTAIQHGAEYYALFPLANSDLKAVLQRPKSDVQARGYVLWSLQQLAGIADGLSKIHKYGGRAMRPAGSLQAHDLGDDESKFGYHHDLKPENILVFTKLKGGLTGLEAIYGRWQIHDFGLGRIRDQAQGTRTYTTRGTPTYAAPEAHDRHRSKSQSGLERSPSRPFQGRAYDVWSTGCMMVEVFISLKDGWTGLSSFRTVKEMSTENSSDQFGTNAFFVHKDTGAQLRQVVKTQIDDVRFRAAPGRGGDAIRQVMNVVEQCLNIRPDQGYRITAEKLAKKMKAIVEGIDDLRDYGDFFLDTSNVPEGWEGRWLSPASHSPTWPFSEAAP